MSPDAFDHLAKLLQPVMQKQNTNFRQPNCLKERLAVTLRYLASDDSHPLLGWAHHIGKAAISKIIKETTNTSFERSLFEATSRSIRLESHIQRI